MNRLLPFIFFIALAGLFGGLVGNTAVANAKDFGSPPGHIARVDKRVFMVDSGWWDVTKDQICPGQDGGVKHHHTQKGGNIQVECNQDTFFKPEVPVIHGSPANSYYPQVRTILKPTKVYVTKTKFATRVRSAPTMLLSILLGLGGVAVGGGIATMFMMARRPA